MGVDYDDDDLVYVSTDKSPEFEIHKRFNVKNMKARIVKKQWD